MSVCNWCCNDINYQAYKSVAGDYYCDEECYKAYIIDIRAPEKSRTPLEAWGDLADKQMIAEKEVKKSALAVQPGGNHYKTKSIQPVEYIHANGIGYFEGNVIKYVTRWREKGGLSDLLKAKHYIDLLIELEGLGDKSA